MSNEDFVSFTDWCNDKLYAEVLIDSSTERFPNKVYINVNNIQFSPEDFADFSRRVLEKAEVVRQRAEDVIHVDRDGAKITAKRSSFENVVHVFMASYQTDFTKEEWDTFSAAVKKLFS